MDRSSVHALVNVSLVLGGAAALVAALHLYAPLPFWACLLLDPLLILAWSWTGERWIPRVTNRPVERLCDALGMAP